MGTKARVQDDGSDSGHARVAVYASSGGTGWALLGHLRPRTGAETEQTVRDLADGMAVEDRHGDEIAFARTPAEELNAAMRAYLGTIANRLGIVHAHIANGDTRLDTPARVENVGEDIVGEIEALRGSTELWEQARLLTKASSAYGSEMAAEALQLATERIATIVRESPVFPHGATTAPGPRRSMTVDDVAAVCVAAGLEHGKRAWSDSSVMVETVTTSCLPIGPGDARPFVGIFVWNRASDRREDLTRHCSPILLRAVIDDVRAHSGE